MQESFIGIPVALQKCLMKLWNQLKRLGLFFWNIENQQDMFSICSVAAVQQNMCWSSNSNICELDLLAAVKLGTDALFWDSFYYKLL